MFGKNECSLHWPDLG
uniref:Uncharacterized protein n=1 Tax=Arundo donax TaxID=35708 RepID=A0A0A9C0R9_ARUDO